MCGIYGIWNFDGAPVSQSEVLAATDRLRHRGPDDEGYLVVETRSGKHSSPSRNEMLSGKAGGDLARLRDGNLGFGFRRLAILDLTPAGHQPMVDASGRRWIIYNGEVYNYREIRSELQGKGYVFKSGSDTEVVLAAYDCWGSGCLGRFNGMWALAIFDIERKTLFLARDRFGVKPLYYALDGRRLLFASEPKALLGNGGVRFSPDVRAVADYLVTSSLPIAATKRTFFCGIESLEPGTWMEIASDGVPKVQRYWELHDRSGHQTGRVDPAGAAEQYRELLDDAVRLRLRSDVPVGSCLSGGLDSSAITMLAVDSFRKEGRAAKLFNTFSVVYDTNEACNEIEHAQRVVSSLGVESHFVRPDWSRIQSEVDMFVWHQDEPVQTTSQFAQWCVMGAARDAGVPVVLEGQGADEALGGYRPFEPYLKELISSGHLLEAWRQSRGMRSVCGIGRGGALLRSVLRTVAARPVHYFAERSRRRCGIDRLIQPAALAARSERKIEPYPDLGAELLYEATKHPLPWLLRYGDRNSMAFSVENRVPFMDYRLMEFSFSLPSSLKLRDGWTKWVLRKAMDKRLPDEITWRRDKVGFATPELHWMKALVRSNCGILTDGGRLSEYVKVPQLREELDRWLSGGPGYLSSQSVWRLVNTAAWLRCWSA